MVEPSRHFIYCKNATLHVFKTSVSDLFLALSQNKIFSLLAVTSAHTIWEYGALPYFELANIASIINSIISITLNYTKLLSHIK